jgi:hypothetical protein
MTKGKQAKKRPAKSKAKAKKTIARSQTIKEAETKQQTTAREPILAPVEPMKAPPIISFDDAPETPPETPKTTIIKRKIGMMILPEVPIVEVDERAYVSRHLEVRITPEQGKNLKIMLAGCVHKRLELKNGKPIKRAPDVIRHLLESCEPK